MKQTFLKITEDYEGSIGDQLEIISDTNDTDDINPNIQNKKLTLLYYYLVVGNAISATTCAAVATTTTTT